MHGESSQKYVCIDLESALTWPVHLTPYRLHSSLKTDPDDAFEAYNNVYVDLQSLCNQAIPFMYGLVALRSSNPHTKTYSKAK